MSGASIAYGESNTDPNLGPVVNLPSFSPKPVTKIEITPAKNSSSDTATRQMLAEQDPGNDSAALPASSNNTAKPWDAWPDATSSEPVKSADINNAKLSDDSNNTAKPWDAWPDEPSVQPKEQKPSYMEDLGKTVIGSTIPRAIAGMAMIGPNMANLPGQVAAWGINKWGYDPLTGKPLTDEQRQHLSQVQPFYSSENALQDISKYTGLPAPYEPQYKANQYIDTAGQFVLGGKSLGKINPALAASTGKLASAGVASQASSDLYPNNPIAPLIGAMVGERGANYTGKATNFAKNKLGIGAKTQIGDVMATDYQIKQAAQNINNAAINPAQVIQDTGEGSIPNGQMGPMPQQSNARSIVAGSNPTLAEATNDQGIAQYQDMLRTKNPEVFQQRTGEQNEARANALNEVKGAGNPENLGDFLTQHLQAEDATAIAAEQKAHGNAVTKGARIGSYGELPSEGITGDTVQNAQTFRKENTSKAWKVLEPFQNSSADLETLRDAARGVGAEASQYGAQPLESHVARIVSDIAEPANPAKDTLGALQRFRSNISDAQREVKSGSQSMRYLQMLKNAVDKGISNTVNHLEEQHQHAVSAGEMSPELTISARMEEALGDALSKQFGTGLQISAGNAGDAITARGASKQSGGNPGTGRAGSETKSGFPDSKNLQAGEKTSQPVGPKFGEEQRQQYEKARGLTLRHETLSRLENSGAVNPDGTLDAKKYDRWYQKNKSLFKSNPEFAKELTDWRNAQEQLNNLKAEAKIKQAETDKSRLQAITKNDPVIEIGKMFRSGNPVKEFSDLVQKVKGDASAMEGLKSAVGEHLLKVARADIAEEGSSLRSPQALRDFIRTHNKSLKIIYGGQGINTLEASMNEFRLLENVDKDIRRTQQWNERAKIKGQSNTAKDLNQVAKNDKTSIFSKIAKHGEIVGAVTSKMMGHGAGEGFVAGLPLKVINAFHSAGLDTIRKVELEMIKNPSFAHVMLKSIAAKEIPIPLQKRIATTLLNVGPQAIAHEEQKRKHQ